MDALAALVLPNLEILVAAALQMETGIGFALTAVPLLDLIDLGWLPSPMLQAGAARRLARRLRSRRSRPDRPLGLTGAWPGSLQPLD